MISRRHLTLGAMASAALGTLHAQDASSSIAIPKNPVESPKGIQPELSALLISEADGVAQMPLRSLDSVPLLLHTRIVDVPEDPGLVVVPVPSVIRMEPKARQIVRFALERPAQPLKVQHYKRVTFEGIPPIDKGRPGVKINLNIRYDLPVIISPKGLEHNYEPWELLKWSRDGGKIRITNPSPYIVRLSREVDFMSKSLRVLLLPRTFVLPGEAIAVDIPEALRDVAQTSIRIHPATIFGGVAKPFDAKLES